MARLDDDTGRTYVIGVRPPPPLDDELARCYPREDLPETLPAPAELNPRLRKPRNGSPLAERIARGRRMRTALSPLPMPP